MSRELDDLDRTILRHLQARFPTSAAEAEAEQLRRAAILLFQAADRLRSVRLTNADEPAPIFHPYRGAD